MLSSGGWPGGALSWARRFGRFALGTDACDEASDEASANDTSAAAQVMTIGGLLMGMTLPAILSDDWRHPGAFSARFALGLGALVLAAATLLSRFKAPEGQEPLAAAAPRPPAPVAPAQMGTDGEGSILANRFFRLLLLNVFLCQVGNALLASTQPLYARHVIGLVPVGPLLHGLVPVLDAKWQFSLCYLLFYSMGAASSRFWYMCMQVLLLIASGTCLPQPALGRYVRARFGAEMGAQ